MSRGVSQVRRFFDPEFSFVEVLVDECMQLVEVFLPDLISSTFLASSLFALASASAISCLAFVSFSTFS